jgi:hypothetical protein
MPGTNASRTNVAPAGALDDDIDPHSLMEMQKQQDAEKAPKAAPGQDKK